jgi:hypothetical protein
MVLMKHEVQFPYRKAVIVLEMISSASQRISGMKLIWKT